MLQRIVVAVAVITASWWNAQSELLADDPAPPPKVDRYGDPLPSGAIARLGTVRWRHPTRKFDMAFSADGKELVVTGFDKTIRYYDLEGKPLRTVTIDVQRLVGYQPDSRPLVLSPDGKVAAALGFANDEARRKTIHYLKCVELPSGKELMSLSSETAFGDSPSSRINFLHDGRTAVIWTGSGRVRFWDMIGGTELLDSKPLMGFLSALAVSADGTTLALAARTAVGEADDVDLYLWKWLDEDKPQKLAAGRGAQGLAFSSDGKWLAASEFVLAPAEPSGARQQQARDMRLYDLKTLKPAKDFKALSAKTYFTSVVFSPDAKLLAAIEQQSRAVIVWNVATGKEVRAFEGAPQMPQLLAFSPDSRRLAIDAGDGQPIAVRSLDTGEARGVKQTSPAGYFSQAAFFSGGAVMTGDSSGAVRAWEATSGKPLWDARHPGDPRHSTALAVRGLAVSPDGKLVASTGYDDSVRLWNAATGKEIFRLPGHGRSGRTRLPLTFTPDSRRLVSTADDLFVRVWDVRTGKATAEHAVRPKDVEIEKTDDGAVAGGPGGLDPPMVSADGSVFAVFLGKSIAVYDVPTGRLLREVPLEAVNSWFCALSPDGTYFVRAEMAPQAKFPDGRWRPVGPDSLRLIDLATGKTVGVIPLPEDQPRMAVFSPDGRHLATLSSAVGAPIRIWRVATGAEVATLRGFDAQVTTLAFSPDNKLLVSGFFDTTALVWDVA